MVNVPGIYTFMGHKIEDVISAMELSSLKWILLLCEQWQWHTSLGPEYILQQQETKQSAVVQVLDSSLVCLCPTVPCPLKIVSEA